MDLGLITNHFSGSGWAICLACLSPKFLSISLTFELSDLWPRYLACLFILTLEMCGNRFLSYQFPSISVTSFPFLSETYILFTYFSIQQFPNPSHSHPATRNGTSYYAQTLVAIKCNQNSSINFLSINIGLVQVSTTCYKIETLQTVKLLKEKNTVSGCGITHCTVLKATCWMQCFSHSHVLIPIPMGIPWDPSLSHFHTHPYLTPSGSSSKVNFIGQSSRSKNKKCWIGRCDIEWGQRSWYLKSKPMKYWRTLLHNGILLCVMLQNSRNDGRFLLKSDQSITVISSGDLTTSLLCY